MQQVFHGPVHIWAPHGDASPENCCKPKQMPKMSRFLQAENESAEAHAQAAFWSCAKSPFCLLSVRTPYVRVLCHEGPLDQDPQHGPWWCSPQGTSHDTYPDSSNWFEFNPIYFYGHYISLDDQRMSKKQREQKVEVDVLSLSSKSCANESEKSSSSQESDTSPIKHRLRPSTKRRHIVFHDSDDSNSDKSSKHKRTPDSESPPAKGGQGFDSDALELENAESSRSLQVLKPPKQLQQILMHVCRAHHFLASTL